MNKTHLGCLWFALVSVCLCACVPPIYVYDRLSVMEENASGDYPLFREEMLERSEASGPLMLSPNQAKVYQEEREKIFRIVNGEYRSSELGEEKLQSSVRP